MSAEDLIAVYAGRAEGRRLAAGRNQVEWIRTCELLTRWLPATPARVLDVGGGTGAYATWLASLGHDVMLLDLVPDHVERARTAGLHASVADARSLPVGNASADVVLLLGPLYYLSDHADRHRALAEACRVFRPAGLLVAAALSRWAKPLAQAAAGRLDDPAEHDRVAAVLRDGRHPGGSSWDQITYNHDPAELAHQLRTAHLHNPTVVGVEGPLDD